MITYLLLGSNEGDRQEWLRQAMEQIKERIGVITKRSAVYSTAAWGLEEQPDFLNMAIEVETNLPARELLTGINAIEQALGRQRTVKWGQRTLDIDILFYGNEIIDETDLKVPHPALQDRRFALAPLNEIAAGYVHPHFKKTIRALLAECDDPLEVSVVAP
jgi:2-amino-4-hydroxy-6-hydroxymethyldihydropteridine diphosphokinase